MAGKLQLFTATLLIVVFASADAAVNCDKNFPTNTCTGTQFCAAPGNSQDPSQFKCYECPCKVVPDQCRLGKNKKVTCDCTGSGFTGPECRQDVDECLSSPPVCDTNASCQNTVGSYTCSCNPGFSGDGTPGNCANINECANTPSVCDENASCADTVGSYTCTCNTGYTGNGAPNTCQNINECDTLSQPCPVTGYKCNDKIPGFCCDPKKNDDLDTLLIVLFASADAAVNCDKNFPTNTCTGTQFCAAPGNSQDPSQFKCYECPCKVVPDQCRLGKNKKVTCDCTGSGFTGPECRQDVDECLSSPPVCDTNASCQNTVGSYTCSCNPGFSGDGTPGNCANINECANTPSVCDENASCADTVGSYTCTCNTGYTGNGAPKTCQNINECDTLSQPCHVTGYKCKDKTPGFCCDP